MGEKEWSSGWIQEGNFLSYLDRDVRRYYFVKRRDFAHIEHEFDEIGASASTGPVAVEDLELTEEYTQLWQLIFGISPDIYVYVWAPVVEARHGVAKRALPSATLREVAHYEQWMSPWDEPDWCTEHFLQRPLVPRIAFSFYNPHDIAVKPALNFFVNKMELEHIGDEEDGKLTPAKDIYKETLDKLYRKVIPHRPITLTAVKARAEA